MKDLVLQALAAGDHAPDSPVAVYALDTAVDVYYVLQRAEGVINLGGRGPYVDPQIAAVNLVLVAQAETARGVRRLPPGNGQS